MAAVDFVAPLTGLAQNVALLLSLTLLYGVIRPHWMTAPAAAQTALDGTLFGLIAIAGMHTPIVIAPGVIADARVIPVLLAGPFAGVGAAVTAAGLAGLYRLWLGGAGSLAGLGTILTAGALGVAVALRWRGRAREPGPAAFFLLGLALDATLLLWSAALPAGVDARRVVGAAAIPVGLFLPFGTLALGLLLVHTSRRHEERERLMLTQWSLEHTAEALLWIDSAGRIVHANAAAVRLTGYARDELLALRVWDLDLDTDGRRWPEQWAAARAAGSVTAQRRWRRRDGGAVPVETSSDHVECRGRAWISVFARDITERQRVERERALLLAREREANVLKDQFLAVLSHELRTPLTSILGYARLLRGGSLRGETASRALELIDRNARAQAQIVDDLLDMSSVVLGKLRVDRRPVDLAPLVDGEVEAARPEAEARGLALQRRVVGPVPAVVLGDAGRLQQLVRNLLSNALKFTPPGGRIVATLEIADGREARLVVQDTGSGIEPAFLPHVFDRFRQADSSMTRVHGGLGVGLAIVRDLVALHGGRVWADSPGPGQGATFTVALPLLRASQPARDGDVGDGTAALDLDGVRVLVVEDEAETRELVAMVLGRCGAEVTAAASADQALDEVQRVRPDVLVSDVAMPDGDGYTLLRRIRALTPERGGRTPAAALTAYAGREEAARARAAGFEARVVKPFEPAELVRVVAELSRRCA